MKKLKLKKCQDKLIKVVPKHNTVSGKKKSKIRVR